MFQSLILSIICIIGGIFLIIRAKVEFNRSKNITPEEREKQRQKEEKFSGRTLYFSNVALREKQECYLRKKGIFEDMNTIERAECKTAIYWILRYIDEIFLEDTKNFFTQQGKRRLHIALNNLLSMIACFRKEQIQEDLTTVCKLFQYALEKEDVGGIFYAHHILSDINFWILDQPFLEEEFETWQQKPPKQKETKVFYGMARSWEYPYPKDITKRIKAIALPKEEEIFDIKSHFAKKQMELAQTFYTLEQWQIQQILQYCDAIGNLLNEIIHLKAADIEVEQLNEMELALINQNDACTKGIVRHYAALMRELNKIIELLPEGCLQSDFNEIKQGIQEVYDNQDNVEYASYEPVLWAKRMIDEINHFVLPKEIDWNENHFYYGLTATMRDREPDPVMEIDGVETVVPAERDFFARIILTENGTEKNNGK